MTGKEFIENDPTLREIVRRIVEGWHPDRIILFGSRARGEADEHSDYDLLVVMPYEGSPYQIAGEMHKAIGAVGVSKDILITTPEAFERRRPYIGTIEHDADRDGHVLYEGAPRGIPA